MKSRVLTITVPFVVMVACTRPESAGLASADSTALRAVLDSSVTAIVGRDWPAVASHYAADAVLMPPNGPAVTGATAISQWFANTGLQIAQFTTEVISMEGQPALAAVRGTYVLAFTIPPATQTVTDTGKFLWLVRREPSGQWRITADIFNTSMPLPSP